MVGIVIILLSILILRAITDYARIVGDYLQRSGLFSSSDPASDRIDFNTV